MDPAHLPAHLKDRAVIALAGAEARGFLQGLVTNDVEALVPGKALYAALLTPQGKILFDFFVVEGEGALLLDCAGAAAEALVKRLKLYRLRAKVEIELRPQLGVYTALAGHPDNRPVPYGDRAISFSDPRLEGLPRRSISAIAEMPAGLPGPDAYHVMRRSLGVPEGEDFGSDHIFALDAGLDELQAVSFAKGCYVGQELTARMKHRGTARKRLLMVKGAGALTMGARISGKSEIGEIAAVHDAQGFALIRMDRLAEDAGPYAAGDVAVTISKPAFL